MTIKQCEYCAHFILRRGIVHQYVCLREDDLDSKYFESDGRDCPLFEENCMTINGKRVVYRK
jgi:hypothetical protein